MESANKIQVSQNKIQVVEFGNKRKAANKEDLVQALSDIKNWFSEHHPDYFESTIKNRSSVGQDMTGEIVKHLHTSFIERHVKLLSVQAVLEQCPANFQLLDTYKLIPASKFSVVEKSDESGNPDYLLLIAEEAFDGCFLAVTADDSVMIYDPNEGYVTENLNTTLSAYIEDIRNNLLLRKLTYEGPDLGLVTQS